jgi:plastocyanin
VKKILILIILLVAAGGLLIFAQSDDSEDADMKDEDEKMEETMPDSTMMDDDWAAAIALAPSLALADVADSGAFGTAWLAIRNTITYHRVIAENMTALTGTDFYEGWLVREPAPGGFVSTGRMEYDPVTKRASLEFQIEGDMSDYRGVVITLEPDDGDPAPAAHIIEARYAGDVRLNLDIVGEAATFDLTGHNFAFSQDLIRVKKGDTVTINFASTEGFHDWVIDQFDARTSRVNAGGRTSIEFVANEVGTFEFYCSVGNHRQQGMVGTLIIE